MHFFGCSIERCARLKNIAEVTVKIDIARWGHLHQITMTENFTLSALRENDKFMRQISADWTRIGLHRNGFNAKPCKCIQIGREHFII